MSAGSSTAESCLASDHVREQLSTPVFGTMEERRARLVAWLRAEGIVNESVLAAIGSVPRELFVPPEAEPLAYLNLALHIGAGQIISSPYAVALGIQALELVGRGDVLEIGTGCGYAAAVLAQLCRHVFTIERHAALLEGAQRRLARLGIANVTTRHGDGTKGWLNHPPFERILCSAGAPVALPRGILACLADRGVLVAPVREHMVRVRRAGERFETEELESAMYVPLVEGMPAQN